ncbi:LLM class flavin-dependent oxidoreductase [Hoeflea sp. 108]|uniref:LLM class flavin-dependent oxidoreductase n=1 Tax=Hoeflea sp. 108 TaxID=1116369 RepID=UPI00039FAB0D|nr:LLM class flavin-dependent oxidoreductase [Hoeflea sp. 108]
MQIDFTHCPGGVADSEELHPSFFSDTALAVQRLRQIEDAGFSRVLVDDMAGLLANMDLALLALRATGSLGVLVSHWPGIVAPVVAARQFAALEQLGAGRLSLRVPSHRNWREVREDDDLVGNLGRTDEYLTLLKRLWANAAPFDHEGAFYRVDAGFVPLKPVSGIELPLQLGGLSGIALKVAGRHADRFELPADSLRETVRLIGRVKVAAEPFGRAGRIRFSLPVQAGEGGEDWHLGRSPEAWIGRLAAFVEAGVTDFIVHGLDDADAIGAFGRKVIPQLRKTFKRHEHRPPAYRGHPVQLRRVV